MALDRSTGSRKNDLLCGVLACCIIAIAGCDRAETRQRQRVEKAEREWQVAVSDFAARNKACADWEPSIPQQALDSPFTIDLSRALIRTNGQPVVLVMDLADVAEKNGDFSVTFSTSIESIHGEIKAELKCTEALANRLLKGERGNASYAVVARIESVSRAKLELSGVHDEAGIRVDSEYFPDIFLAKGVCIDALAKGESTGRL